MKRRIALIAHDGKKDAMVRFAAANKARLQEFDIVATGSTGRMIAEVASLTVDTVRHGPAGGDVQIAAQVLEGQIAAVIFFVEPMDVHPHDPDIQTLLRICNIMNVPLATNAATAELIMGGGVVSHEPLD